MLKAKLSVFPGCVGYALVIRSSIRHGRRESKESFVNRLDIANANNSVPRIMIFHRAMVFLAFE